MHNVASTRSWRVSATLCMYVMHNVALTRQDRVDATLCMLAGGSDPPPYKAAVRRPTTTCTTGV